MCKIAREACKQMLEVSMFSEGFLTHNCWACASVIVYLPLFKIFTYLHILAALQWVWHRAGCCLLLHSEHKQYGHPGHLITVSISTHIYPNLHISTHQLPTSGVHHSINHIITKLYYNVRSHDLRNSDTVDKMTRDSSIWTAWHCAQVGPSVRCPAPGTRVFSN